MKRILFVCTGNICRSAMAEGYLKKKLEQLNMSNEYIVESAGIRARDFESATTFAINSMKRYEVDISDHKASHIFNFNLSEYDYVFCMTKEQLLYVMEENPDTKNKCYLLKQFVQPSVQYIDIDDPWGLDIKVYENCANEIVKSIDYMCEKHLI